MQREIPAARARGGLHRLALRGEPLLIALAKRLGARRAQPRQRRPCRENPCVPRRETSPRPDRRSSAHGLPRPPPRARRSARRSRSGSARKSPISTSFARAAMALAGGSGSGAGPGAARISAKRSITSRAAIGRAEPEQADPLAAAHREIGERQDQHGRAVAASSPGSRSERKFMLSERSNHSHSVCAASHSRSRTKAWLPRAERRQSMRLRRLARGEDAELPEILARPGAPASMHAVHQTMRQTPRGDDEVGQPRAELGRLFAGTPRVCRRHVHRTYLATSRATTPATVSPSARAG